MKIAAYSTLPSYNPAPGASQDNARGFAALYEEGGSQARQSSQWREFADQLTGLRGYILSTYDNHGLLDAGGIELLELLDHVDNTMWEYPIELDVSTGDNFQSLLNWARRANAVLFMEDGMIINPDGQPLLPTPSASLGRAPHLSDSLERARRVRHNIATETGATIPSHNFVVRSSEELIPKSISEIRTRAIGLSMVSDFAVSVLKDNPIDPQLMEETAPEAFAQLTPQERELFDTEDRRLATVLQWRLEGVGTLMWALSQYDLPSPFTGHNTDSRTAFPKALDDSADFRLRPLSDLVDAQQTYRDLMWAAMTDRIERPEPGEEGLFNPDAGVERLWALNWLLNAHETDWDSVDVNAQSD